MKKVTLSKKQLNIYFKNLTKAKLHFYNRINYIIDKIAIVFGCECVKDSYAMENSYLNFLNYSSEDDLYFIDAFCTFKIDVSKLVFLNKNNEELYLIDGIPIKWLFSDFENELINGRKLFLKKLETEAKEKEVLSLSLKEKEKKSKQMIKSALKKLNKEEIAALNLIRVI